MSKSIQSIERALAIFELLSTKNCELGIQELSDRLSLPNSTIHGIIKTLETHGYIDQNPHNKKYKLGIRLFQLGNIVGQSFDIKSVAAPYIQQVFDSVNETVHLVRFDGHEAVYIDKAEGNSALRMYSQVGKSAPLYCTGVGKAILAFLGDEQINNILDHSDLKAFTEYTKTDKAQLLEELTLTKQRGYSVDDEEIELGLYCIAAPIFSSSGKVIGSLSTAGPKSRFNEEKRAMAVQLIREGAKGISRSLGYVD